MINSNKPVYTVKQAVEKLAKYCAYQERSQWEVRNKMNDFQLSDDQKEEVIVELIQHDFLNEQRFAESFARGKFVIKKWGRIKISNELKKHKVSQRCLQLAFKEIDAVKYEATLIEILEKRLNKVKRPLSYKEKSKATNYALSRGYELDIILSAMSQLD